MKATFLSLAVLGLSYGAVIPTARDVNQDLQDFVYLIPKDEIIDIIAANMRDPEVQAVIDYIFGDEFKGLIKEIEAMSEYKAVMSYLNETGLSTKKWVAWFHQMVGLARSRKGVVSTGKLNGFIEHIKAIPINKIMALYSNKLSSSPDFRKLVDKLTNPTFEKIARDLVDNKKVKDVANRLRAVGANVDEILALLKLVFGFYK